jgi:hypothetical protein
MIQYLSAQIAVLIGEHSREVKGLIPAACCGVYTRDCAHEFMITVGYYGNLITATYSNIRIIIKLERKGFGFINNNDGGDVFVHYSASKFSPPFACALQGIKES